jgi:outer membrane protein
MMTKTLTMNRPTETLLMKLSLVTGATLAAALIGGTAHAQSAGNWSISLGANNIAPKVKSGDLSAPSLPGTKIDVKDASAGFVTFTYMLTDQVALQTFLGGPYKHDIVGAGAIDGVGKIGEVRQVSPTVIAQYRFLEADAALRPYVGLGVTYAYFFKEKGSGTLTALTNPGGAPTRVDADNAWGVSPQLGVVYAFNQRWFADLSVIKTYIKNTTHLSTGQSIDAKLDPLSVGLTVGYRF